MPFTETKRVVETDAETGERGFSILLILLLAVSLIGWFVGLGSYGIIDPGDGYFSEAAREMMESGQFVVPVLNYQIYFSKPIMTYWLICLAYQFFGVTEMACRLPSAISASVLVVMTGWLGIVLKGRTAGLLSAVVLAATPLYVTFARMSLVDMPFTLFLVAAVYAAVLVVSGKDSRWWPFVYIAVGLAILTKGPAAAVLCALCLCLFILTSKLNQLEWRAYLRRLHLLEGLIISVLTAAPWYILVGLKTNWLWPKVFFVFENFGRFLGAVNHDHPSPLYYVVVLLYGFFPWVLFLPGAIKRFVLSSSNGTKHPGVLFLACWIFTVVAFFTCSAAKVSTYILPALPACALLVGFYLSELVERKLPIWRPVSIIFSAGGAACLVLSLAVLFMLEPTVVHLTGEFAEEFKTALGHLPSGFVPTVITAVVIFGLALVIQGLLTIAGRELSALKIFVSTISLGCLVGAQLAFAGGYELRQSALRELVKGLAGASGQVAFYREFKPSVMFYLKRPVDTFFSPVNLTSKQGASAGSTVRPSGGANLYVIASSSDADVLQQAFPEDFVVFSRNYKWSILRSASLGLIPLPTLQETFSWGLNLSGKKYHWGTLPFSGGRHSGDRGLKSN